MADACRHDGGGTCSVLSKVVSQHNEKNADEFHKPSLDQSSGHTHIDTNISVRSTDSTKDGKGVERCVRLLELWDCPIPGRPSRPVFCRSIAEIEERVKSCRALLHLITQGRQHSAVSVQQAPDKTASTAIQRMNESEQAENVVLFTGIFLVDELERWPRS